MNKVILFDLDGTLIDSTDAIVQSFQNVYKDRGLTPPLKEDILPQIGYPLFDMFVNLGVCKSEAPEYVLEYREHYQKVYIAKTKLLPGAKDAVQLAFNAKARVGVVTTKTGKYSKKLLEHFGIMKFFEVLIGSEDVKKHKPDPEPIIRALECMKVTEKENVYMVGDTCMDMKAAQNAGVAGIGVEFKYTRLDDLKRCSKLVKCCVFEAVSDILNNKI